MRKPVHQVQTRQHSHHGAAVPPARPVRRFRRPPGIPTVHLVVRVTTTMGACHTAETAMMSIGVGGGTMITKITTGETGGEGVVAEAGVRRGDRTGIETTMIGIGTTSGHDEIRCEAIALPFLCDKVYFARLAQRQALVPFCFAAIDPTLTPQLISIAVARTRLHRCCALAQCVSAALLPDSRDAQCPRAAALPYQFQPGRLRLTGRPPSSCSLLKERSKLGGTNVCGSLS